MHFYGPTTAPASGVAPTVLVGSPYPSPGETRTDEDVGDRIGLATLRGAGYNVLTWDPRGIGASAGSIMFDSPAIEGRDVRAIVDYVAAQPEAQLDAPGDPRVGMSGTSYGATIQYIAAALDARIDAIVPDIAWESLTTALRRGGAVKTGWLAALCGLDAVPGAVDGKATDERRQAGDRRRRAQGGLPGGHPRRAVEGQPQVARRPRTGRADRAHPRAGADHAGHDRHAVSARPGERGVRGAARATGVPVTMLWYCGGHVACDSEPGDPRALARAGLAWLDRWLRPDPSVDTGAAVSVARRRRRVALGPGLPARVGRRARRRRDGLAEDRRARQPAARPRAAPPAPARNSVDVRFPAPAGEADLVGNPRVRLVYRGRAKPERTFLYAQIVDGEADRVLGGLGDAAAGHPRRPRAHGGAPAGGDRRARRPRPRCIACRSRPARRPTSCSARRGRVSIYGAFGSLPLVDATRSGYGFVRRTPTRPRVTVTSRRSRRDGRDARVSLRVRLPVAPVRGQHHVRRAHPRRPYVYNAELTPRPCRAARKVTLRVRRGSRLRVTATFNGNPELKPRDSRTLARNAR